MGINSAGKEQHIIPYAFPVIPVIENNFAGGLPAVIADEVHRRGREVSHDDLVIISSDPQALSLPDMSTEVLPADSETTPNPGQYEAWFSAWWSYLHPVAHSRRGYTDPVLDAMYQGKYASSQGSIERIKEHDNSYGPYVSDPDVTQRFADRFRSAITSIKDGATINWQDYFFVEAMLEHADDLRARGCFQTFHLHTTLPEELAEFPRGRMLLEAMSKMDQVYVHTDEYKDRLTQQLTKLGLPIPDVRRFDLGPDRRMMAQGLTEVNAANYKAHIEYAGLTTEQKTFVDEVFTTQGKVPHRFIDIDRLDPGKGTSDVFAAVDHYLTTSGMNLDEMRASHRFFFVMPQMYPNVILPYHLQHQYIQHVRGIGQELMKKFPGVIFISPELPRIFIPSMLKGANIMTGGTQDGLHLSSQEALHVNALSHEDVSGIIGIGTGFAMQTLRDYPEAQNLVHFTPVGDVGAIARAIKNIVEMQRDYPGILAGRTQKLVATVINGRRDSVIIRK